jgi:hypothetical protein
MRPKAALARERNNDHAYIVPSQRGYPVTMPHRRAEGAHEISLLTSCADDKLRYSAEAAFEAQPPAYNGFRKYDSKGNVIEEGLYRFDDLVYRWLYDYNVKGKKAQANLYNAGGFLLVRCLYDDEEKLVKRFTYKDGACNREIEYEYDNTTEFIGSVVHMADGSKTLCAHLRM